MSSNANLYAAYAKHFPADLNQPLLTTPAGGTLSYGEADRESARIANYLTASGASPGDRVTVQVEKSTGCLCLYLACLRAGLVYHPLNTAYQSGELAYFLENAEPAIVVCSSDAQAMIEPLLPETTRALLTMDSDGSGSLAEAVGKLQRPTGCCGAQWRRPCRPAVLLRNDRPTQGHHADPQQSGQQQ